METKICKKCKRELPMDLIHFNKCASTWDGFHLYCKECRGYKFRTPYNYGVNEETERKCSACQTVYPKTEEFFSWDNKQHTKLSCVCKKCKSKKMVGRLNKTEYNRNYRNTHREQDAQRCSERYKRIISNGISLTRTQYDETLKYFNYSCAYCGSEGVLTQDHVLPITKGGKTEKSNIIPACGFCNISKSNRYLHQWYKNQDFFDESRFEKIIQFINEN